jgi:polyisoprenoid-binding protein YceI
MIITVGECRIQTSREGALSAVGHDLTLRATRWSVDVQREARTVTVRVPTAGIDLVGARHGDVVDAHALSVGDRTKIEHTLRDDVLHVARYPEVVFEGRWDGDDPAVVEGSLTLCGVTRPLAVRVARAGGRVVCTATVHQPTWGITPFRAMLGALRVQADVQVMWSLEGL